MQSSRLLLCICALALGLLPTVSFAGNNSEARVWLSWDPAGNRRTLSCWTGADTIFYIQFEGLADVAALAVSLTYSHPTDGAGMVLAPSVEGQQYGWVEDVTAPLEFLGDSTFNKAIRFPGTPRSRERVAYGLRRLNVEAPAYQTAWADIECPMTIVMDHAGQLDTLSSNGGCRVWLGEAGSRALPEPLPGVCAAKVLLEAPSGAIAHRGKHFAASDCPATWQEALARIGFEIGEHVFSESLERPRDSIYVTPGGVAVRMPDLSRWVVLHCTDTLSVDQLIEGASLIPEANHVGPVDVVRPTAVPNDSLLSWYMKPWVPAHIGLAGGWDITSGSDSVVVAIIDSGVDYMHPELDPGDRSRVTRGHDTGDDDDDPMDANGHGTSVASVLGALGNNGHGIAGTVWGVQLVPIKASEGSAWPNADAVANGINWADLLSAEIMNVSLGGNLNGGPVKSAAFTAYIHNRAIFAATGNEGVRGVSSPANFEPYVFAVGGSNGNSDRWVNSNYGPELKMLAPGEFIWALQEYYHDRVLAMDGTSLASPIAAGVAALVKSYAIRNNIVMYNDDLFQLLQQTATDVPPAGWDEESGYGIVNAERALGALRGPNVRVANVSGGAGTRVAHNVELHFLSVPGLGGGAYWGDRYEVRGHVELCGDFLTAPYAWARPLLSRGLSFGDNGGQTIEGAPWARVENVTASGFDVMTYVYYVAYDVQGRVDTWVPCPPEQATIAYMAIGDMAIQGVAIDRPARTCVGAEATWRTTLCGAEPASYEWRVKLAEGGWSDVVGTGNAYTRVVPPGEMGVKVAVTGSLGTVVDSTSTTGEYCVVGVAGEGVGPGLEFGTQSNPADGRCVGWVRTGSPMVVQLDVFDVSGRRIRHLGEVQCKEVAVPWSWDGKGEEGASVGSGVYFVRASSVVGSKVARLVLLR